VSKLQERLMSRMLGGGCNSDAKRGCQLSNGKLF